MILYCIIHTYICISFSVLNFRTILTATLLFIPRDLHKSANEYHHEIFTSTYFRRIAYRTAHADA